MGIMEQKAQEQLENSMYRYEKMCLEREIQWREDWYNWIVEKGSFSSTSNKNLLFQLIDEGVSGWSNSLNSYIAARAKGQEEIDNVQDARVNEIWKLDAEIEKLKEELDIACQSLHEYRDNMATKCDDDWHDARGPLGDGRFYTGRSAMVALSKMPIAVKRRDEGYQEILKNE